MKFKRSTIVAMIILGLIPMIIAAVLYPSLPAQIITNWGFDGEVAYSPKSEIWIIMGISFALVPLFVIIPKIDPKKKNYARFSSIYETFCIIMMLFMAVINCTILLEAMRPGSVSVSKIVPFMVGLLFIYLGNIMPKIKHNYTFGIKTPWALADPEVWSKSNRLAGFISFVGGIVITVSALFVPEKPLFIILMVFVFAFVIIPTAMSYVWFTKKQTDEE